MDNLTKVPIRKFRHKSWKLVFLNAGKRCKVADYYKKQERLLEGFSEMETMAENGFAPGSLTEVVSFFLFLLI